MLPDLALLTRLEAGQLQALVARLRTVGYDAACVAEAETIATGLFETLRLPLVWRQLDDGGMAGAAAGLFCYRRTLPVTQVEALLGELTAPLTAAGVLASTGDGIAATLDLVPWEGMWLFCDPLSHGEDAVMGPGGLAAACSIQLEDCAGGSVLDLGCGAGTIALEAARRGARAVGSDINPRAVAMARINAVMNGIDATFAHGDGAAAAGARFTRIVCHPPYLAGMTGSTWMHGGIDGDELAIRLLAGCPQALEPAGVALFLCEVPRRVDGTKPIERLAAGLDARMDLMVWVWPGPSASFQAAAFATMEDLTLGSRYAEAAARWYAHARQRNILGLHRVLAAARLRTPTDRHPPIRVQLPAQGPPGARRVLRCLSQAAIANGPEQRLLAARVAPAPGRWQATATDPDLEHDRRWTFLPDGSPPIAVDETTTVLYGLLARSPDVGAALTAFTEQAGEDLRPRALAGIRQGLISGTLAIQPGP